LQVFEDGATFVHSGDPARDPDDRGYWATTKLPGNSKPFHAFQVARELVSEVGEAVLRRQQGYGHIGLRRGEPVPEALREERRKADKGPKVANLEAQRTAFQKRERRVEGLRADGEQHLEEARAAEKVARDRADTIPRRPSNDELLGGGAPPAAVSEATVPVTPSVATTANDTSVEPRRGEDALRTLEVGRTHFDNGLKFHRYDGSLSIRDMTHAGRRGKVVDET
jgi:hypothetical protein